ncbi:hypothetical protein SSAG_00759 [Streptomyces sp. Mg1]|nr:hypothetical protein SSAG_00759 [Streptomyces sp. Mg1]
MRDAELTEKITTVHQRSRGTYGAPTHPCRPGQPGDLLFRPRMFSTLKNELGDTHPWPTRASLAYPAAHTAILERSRAGTACTGTTAASTTAVPQNKSPRWRPDQHTK